MWTDWRKAVEWAANEWCPGELAARDEWDYLQLDFQMWVYDNFFVNPRHFEYWAHHAVNENMPRVQAWALDWMINHGYGQSGYYANIHQR